ncbi:hypothetical protein ACFQ60_00540 [Streptomyces zhihengii]
MLRLPSERLVLSADLPKSLARAVATYLPDPGPVRRLANGTIYASIHESLIAELADRSRINGTVEVLRVY